METCNWTKQASITFLKFLAADEIHAFHSVPRDVVRWLFEQLCNHGWGSSVGISFFRAFIFSLFVGNVI